MTQKVSPLAKFRAKRVERILSSEPNRFLRVAWMKRLLAVLMVACSYAYMAALFIPASPYENNLVRGPILSYTTIIGVTAFILLRKSLRRMISLPDEHLDEREIADRDWAYRTGYLVVRRAGLGVSLAIAAMFLATWVLGWVSMFSPSQTFKIVTAEDIDFFNYQLDIARNNGLFNLVINGTLLFTYMAYAFPLILLAWRDARISANKVEAAFPKVQANELTKLARSYFWKLAIFGVGVVLTSLSSKAFGANAMLFGITTYLIFLVLVFSLYLYIWALLKTLKVIRGTEDNKDILILFKIASVVGALVPIALVLGIFFRTNPTWDNPNPVYIPWFLILGLTLVPIQAITFAIIGKKHKS